MKRIRIVFLGSVSAVLCLLCAVMNVAAINYGSGTYNTCDYNGDCSLSLSASSSVSLPLTPTVAGACTVASGTVSVTTESATGYQLLLNDSSATSVMTGQTYGGTVAATTGSSTSPATLGTNAWGYRVDAGAFGTGPSSAQTSGTTPSTSFAKVPASSSPDTLKTTAAVANGDSTTVWYGICATTATTPDTYVTTVTYTAVVNL